MALSHGDNNGFPASFVPTDWQKPLDVDAVLAAIPPDATTKGMFFNDCLKLRTHAGLSPLDNRYTIFKDYPQREFVSLAAKCAAEIYPEMSLREALRQLGHTAYPTMVSTHIGRILFGFLGNDVRRAMKMAGKGYSVSMSHVAVTHINDGEDFAHIRLTDIFIFPDCYQVGVSEGAVEAMGRRGETRVRKVAPHSYEFYIRWWSA